MSSARAIRFDNQDRNLEDGTIQDMQREKARLGVEFLS